MNTGPVLSRGRRRLFRLAGLAVGSVAALLSIELFLRTLPDHGSHEATLYRQIVESKWPRNSRRHRDYAYSQAKPEGVVRMVAVGDSFTYGEGVHFEDAYPKRLERALNDRCGQDRFEVLNFGFRGYNTRQQVGQVNSALRSRPDVLLLGFCLNDADEGAPRGGRKPENLWFGSTPSRQASWLAHRSRLFALVDGALRRSFTNRRNLRKTLLSFEDSSPGWQVCKKSLETISGMARRDGTRAVLVIFPLFFGRTLHESYPLRAIHDKVAAEGRRLGFDVLDLLTAFQGIESRRLVAHPTLDAHPNEVAHRIAADAIQAELLRLGLTGGCETPPTDLPSPWRRSASPAASPAAPQATPTP